MYFVSNLAALDTLCCSHGAPVGSWTERSVSIWLDGVFWPQLLLSGSCQVPLGPKNTDKRPSVSLNSIL